MPNRHVLRDLSFYDLSAVTPYIIIVYKVQFFEVRTGMSFGKYFKRHPCFCSYNVLSKKSNREKVFNINSYPVRNDCCGSVFVQNSPGRHSRVLKVRH